MTLFTKSSMATGKVSSRDIPITLEEHVRWKEGSVPIQRMFPNLSADDREFLLTGITPEEWEESFKEVEREEMWETRP